jgi:hypothetical protein
MKIAEAQRRVRVTTGAAVHDAGCHDLDRGEQPDARAVLVNHIRPNDLDHEVPDVVVGDVAAPIIAEPPFGFLRCCPPAGIGRES